MLLHRGSLWIPTEMRAPKECVGPLSTLVSIPARGVTCPHSPPSLQRGYFRHPVLVPCTGLETSQLLISAASLGSVSCCMEPTQPAKPDHSGHYYRNHWTLSKHSRIRKVYRDMVFFEELKDIPAVVFTDLWSRRFSIDVSICAKGGSAQILVFFFPNIQSNSLGHCKKVADCFCTSPFSPSGVTWKYGALLLLWG